MSIFSEYKKPTREDYQRFPIGSQVKILVDFVDWSFFRIGETGIVIRNSHDYLGIIVKLDRPHAIGEYLKDGTWKTDYMKYDHNFEPYHLELVQSLTFDTLLNEFMVNG